MFYFDIWGFCKFKLVGKFKNINYIYKNLKYFECKEIEEKKLDFIFIYEKFDPPNLKSYTVIKNNYFIKENNVYIKDSYKGVKFNVLINFDLEIPKLYFYGSYFSSILFYYYFILWFFRIIANNKKFLISHASAINYKNKSFVFSGFPQSYKTTLLLNFLKDDFSYISDENIIIGPDNTIYANPGRLKIFPETIKFFPYLKKHLNLKTKFLIYLTSIPFILSKKKIDIVPPVHIEDIIPSSKICKKNKITAFFILNKSINNDLIIKPIMKKEGIQKIIAINKYEQLIQFQYLFSIFNLFSNGNSFFLNYWEKYEENLNNIFTKIPLYEIQLPINFKQKNYTKLKLILERFEI